MLTATYSLVAIAAEQDHARAKLSRLRQHVQSAWKALHQIDFAFIDTTYQRLTQFENFFRRRKIELYLMPAMRVVGREAQNLLRELDALSAAASALLGTIGEQLRSIFDTRARAGDEVRSAVDGYCEKLTQRLEREEKELLPLARHLLSVDDWFAIAAQMLADDGDTRRGRILLPSRAGLAPIRSITAR